MQERAGNVLAQFTGEGGPPRRRPARAPRALRDPHPVATAASTRGCCRATACQLALPRPASRTPPRSRESGMPVARDRHRATPDPAGRPRSTQQGDSTGHARRGPGPQRSPHGPAHQQCRWRLGAIRSRARNLTTVMPRTGSGLELEFRGREGISGTPRPSLGSCRAPRCGWPSPGTRRTSWGRPTDSAIDRPAYIAPSTGFGCDRAARGTPHTYRRLNENARTCGTGGGRVRAAIEEHRARGRRGCWRTTTTRPTPLWWATCPSRCSGTATGCSRRALPNWST